MHLLSIVVEFHAHSADGKAVVHDTRISAMMDMPMHLSGSSILACHILGVLTATIDSYNRSYPGPYDCTVMTDTTDSLYGCTTETVQLYEYLIMSPEPH